MVSTKPYLLRALYEWCVDQALTPYIAVAVDESVSVPRQYVKDEQIVLNVGPEAAHQLVMGNEFVTLQARFGGVAHPLSIPIERIAAIYARENGHGMAFEVGVPTSLQPEEDTRLEAGKDEPESSDERRPRPDPARPHLVRIK